MGLESSGTHITINSINCWDEGTRETVGRLGTGADRTLVCTWANRLSLAAYLTGGAITIGSVSVMTAIQTYPDIPGLVVENIDIEPVQGADPATVGANGMIAYKYARLIVHYRPFDFGSTQLISTTAMDFGTELYTAARDTLKFADNTAVPTSHPIPISVVCFSQSRLNLASIPTAIILAASEAPMSSTTIFGAPAGKILFDGGRSLREHTSAGWNWALEYRFKYRSKPWNYALGIDGTWKEIQRKDGSPLIASSDLNLLFA